MSVLRFALLSVIFLSSTLWASVGKVALLKGEAVAERNAQTITLQNGSLIEDKDAIKTGKDAQVQLLFEDKTVITLGSESEFKIEEYLNDATNPKARFKFNQGTFKTITGQIGKTAPDNFKLETKTATIGIRGTIVKGSTGDKGDVIACLRGLITVMSRHTGAVVEVPAGQFTTIQSNTSPSTPQDTKPGTTDNSLANNTPPPTSPTPTTVASVEQTKNDTIIQNTYTPQGLRTGTLSFEGLATVSNLYSNSFNFSINRTTAETTGQIGQDCGGECAYYPLATPSTGRSEVYSENGFTVAAYIDLATYNEEEDYATNYAYYFSDALFLRAGFIANGSVTPPVGYFGSANLNGIDSTGSQYVSWGIWGTSDWDAENVPLAGEQYWVGGSTITPESKITSLINNNTQYTYNGQVLGKTYDGNTWSAINTAASDVRLIFNFGSSSTLDSANSYIRFSSASTVWDLKPTLNQAVATSGFFAHMTTGNTQNAVNVYSASIDGKFFGSDAQAVGGTLNATADSGTKKAVGVFKAVR